MANNNGSVAELQEDRRAAVEAGLVHYQLVADERDRLAKELTAARGEIAGLKMALEVQTSQINVMESRVQAMQLVRDQAVAERAKYETLFATVQAMLRTFSIPATPYITGASDEDRPSDNIIPRDESSLRQMSDIQGG